MTVFARLSSLRCVAWMSLALACGGLASSPETDADGAGLDGSAAPEESFSHVTVQDAAGHVLDLRLSEGTRSADGTTTHLRVGVAERSLDLTRRHDGSSNAVTVEENGERLATSTLEPDALAAVDPVTAALLTPAAWQSIDASFSALSDYSLDLAGTNSSGEEAPLLGTATQALSVGSGAINTGGLNAWGCWSSCCESTCTAGHYEPDCCGRLIWVCDARSCTDPCERCIWPY